MMKITLTILFIITIQRLTFGFFGYTRTIYIDKELKNASLIKEIIIHDYTSRIDTLKTDISFLTIKVIDKMIYSFMSNPDSNLTYVSHKSGDIFQNSIYKIADNNISYEPKSVHGFWPAIGDTVLVVFNEEKQVSLFAERVESNTSYRFWSPFYNTSGRSTIFYANYPFESFKPINNKTFGWNKKTYSQLQEYAKEAGYDFACQYHCLINRNEFWNYLQKINK